MVLAIGILIALDVVVKNVAAGVDAQVLHRQRREQARPATAGAHLIHLRELAAGKQAGKPPRRGPGRPPGRKNNKTLERESRELASGNLPAQKRKRGRPAGSRDSIPRRRRTKAEMEQLRRGQN